MDGVLSMKVAVVANGEWDNEWGNKELTQENIDVLICADGGANQVIASGKKPDVLIGDLDSITPENLDKCDDGITKIKKFPKEKDETDLELALEYTEIYLNSYGEIQDDILLYGAGGKRLDHLFGNIALMLKYIEKNRRIIMRDPRYDAWIVKTGTEVIQAAEGQELSLITLSEHAVVTAEGVYYSVNRLALYQYSPRGISNVFTQDEVKLEVHEGKVLVVLSK